MKKNVYLLFLIIGIVSCDKECFQKLTFKEVSEIMPNNYMFFTNKFSSFVSGSYGLSPYISMKIQKKEEKTSEPIINYFFDPVHNNETYSFVTSTFLKQGDYLEKFVVTIEDGERKVGYLRYYPTVDFSSEFFSGKVELLSLNGKQIYEAYIEKDVVIKDSIIYSQLDCVLKFWSGSKTCIGRDKHRHEINCNDFEVVNNLEKYFNFNLFCKDLIINTQEISTPFPTILIDYNPTIKNLKKVNKFHSKEILFIDSLTDNCKFFLDQNKNIKGFILAYLCSSKYSSDSVTTAKKLIDFIVNDEVLGTPDNLLTEFIIKQTLFQ